jgi:hypothetical protein
MKTSTPARIFVLCAVLLAAPLAAADWPSDEAKIRRSLADSTQAFNRGDLKGHLAIYDESVTFMTKDGPRPGVAPIEKAFATLFQDGRRSSSSVSNSLPCAGSTTTPRLRPRAGRWPAGKPEQSGWFTLV